MMPLFEFVAWAQGKGKTIQMSAIGNLRCDKYIWLFEFKLATTTLIKHEELLTLLDPT